MHINLTFVAAVHVGKNRGLSSCFHVISYMLGGDLANCSVLRQILIEGECTKCRAVVYILGRR